MSEPTCFRCGVPLPSDGPCTAMSEPGAARREYEDMKRVLPESMRNIMDAALAEAEAENKRLKLDAALLNGMLDEIEVDLRLSTNHQGQVSGYLDTLREKVEARLMAEHGGKA